MHQGGAGPVAEDSSGLGDQSLSAIAAARGHSVCSRSLVSTVSPPEQVHTLAANQKHLPRKLHLPQKLQAAPYYCG